MRILALNLKTETILFIKIVFSRTGFTQPPNIKKDPSSQSTKAVSRIKQIPRMSSSSSQPSSNQKLYKFVFQANIKTVSLALKFPCVVSVIWKRGQKAQQVKQRKPIQKGIINFNETLEIQCNMIFDMNKKTFEEKKTKFTILIFSQKGNKQAGEVYVDVAQLLNTKNKVLDYEKSLQKCPDKNAKLIFSLQCYMKQEITSDMVSKRSQKTYNIEESLNKDAHVGNMKPDFKKKKNQALIVEENEYDERVGSKSAKKLMIAPSGLVSPSAAKRSQTPNNPSPLQTPTHSLPIDTSSYTTLQQQNTLLKQEVQQLRDLQFQNQNLKRKYDQADKKAQSYYKKKYQEMKQQYNQLKKKSQQVLGLIKKKQTLELTMCECKETIGKIFNYAIITGNCRLMEMMQQLEE